MDFQIRFLEAAVADLDEILAYSWAHYPNTTEQFGRALFAHIDELKRFPYMGSLVRRRGIVRVLVHTPILIFYQVWEEDRIVEILEIRHASRR